ncbi:MAG: uncharacterized protein QOJ54_445 [Aliidongia sp.]|nr:uncharacterized protein [Aliidongia sp.]
MIAPTHFEWDGGKAGANLSKHGIAFEEAKAVFLDPARIEISAARVEDAEDRLKIIGLIQRRLFTVVFVMRGTVCRIISARRSNHREEHVYADRHLDT